MCGRFTIIAEQEALERRFKANFEVPLVPRYNAAPDQVLPVIRNTRPGTIELLRWGIRPVWLAKLAGRKDLINVKAETLREKKTFAGDLAHRRCLVLADSFYEWKTIPGAKRKAPYRILMKSKEPFAFAGIWEEPDREGEGPRFAIITTTPNAVVEKIHNRMPVILTPDRERFWLDQHTEGKDARETLLPFDAEQMEAYPISTLVNRATVDSPAVIMPL